MVLVAVARFQYSPAIGGTNINTKLTNNSQIQGSNATGWRWNWAG
jgi:hypothetical protein